MTIKLFENERIDDLNRNGYKIIQNKKKFCFGMDAVLLSSFACANEGENVVDLGTGTGIIPILMEAKTKASHFSALEIQEDMAEMASRSVTLNKLDHKISIHTGDIKEASKIFGGASFDVVTTNPPYMSDNHGLKNPDISKAIARHEVLCTLDDISRESAKILKPGGRLYMVHRPFRLTDIIDSLRRYKLEPKRIRMVHPYIDKEANMVLIEAIRGGKPLVKVEPPIVVYKESGVYTEEIYTLYGNDKNTHNAGFKEE